MIFTYERIFGKEHTYHIANYCARVKKERSSKARYALLQLAYCSAAAQAQSAQLSMFSAAKVKLLLHRAELQPISRSCTVCIYFYDCTYNLNFMDELYLSAMNGMMILCELFFCLLSEHLHANLSKLVKIVSNSKQRTLMINR